MPERPLVVGVLGCASIADRSTIPAMQRSGRVRVAAIASRDPARAAAFAARHGADACSYEALLSRTDVQAVYVPLPVGLHHAWGRQVLDSEKHLLMEKTFTERHAQAADLIGRASAQGLIAMEALMYRFHPVHVELRRLVRDGVIGELRHIDAQFGFPMLPAGDIRTRRDLGGGASLDSLVYPLSLYLELVPGPVSVVDSQLVVDEAGLDIRGAVQLRSADVTGQIVFGMGLFYRNGCTIWGTDGVISLERAFTRPPDLPAELVLRTTSGTEAIPIGPADHFEMTAGHFASRVAGEDDVSPAEGDELLGRMRVIETIREQAGLIRALDG